MKKSDLEMIDLDYLPSDPRDRMNNDPRHNAEEVVGYAQDVVYGIIVPISNAINKKNVGVKIGKAALGAVEVASKFIPVIGEGVSGVIEKINNGIKLNEADFKNIDKCIKELQKAGITIPTIEECKKKAIELSGKETEKYINSINKNENKYFLAKNRQDNKKNEQNIEQLKENNKKLQEELQKQKERLKKQDQDLQIIKKYLEAQKETQKDIKKRDNLNLDNSPLSEISANKERLVQTRSANHDLTKRIQENTSQVVVSRYTF